LLRHSNFGIRAFTILFSIDVPIQQFSLTAMNAFSSVTSPGRQYPGHLNIISATAIFLFLALALSPVRAEDPDAQYLQIFDIIQQGDSLKKNGQTDNALAKYRQAQVALSKFQRGNPERDAKVVAYRLNYVSNQIAVLSPQASNAGTNEAPSGSKSASTGAVQIKLLEPGAEPRQALRFHPKPGDKQSMLMTMKMGMGIKMGASENPPIKLPVMKMAMDVTIKDVGTNGDISYDIVMSDAGIVDDPEVIAQVAEAMKNALGTMKGVGGKGVISSRGVNKGTDIKAPEGADPQVNQFVDQMKETMSRVASPLPEEPVGAGAKWEVKMPVKSQGMSFTQTATFELASLDGDRAAARTTVTQTAANQKIANPMMPGSKVDLNKMTGNGTGEVTLDFAQILPPEASVEYHQDMAMSMTTGGQKQTIAMKLDLNLHIESK
jgi:hypothetical protein